MTPIYHITHIKNLAVILREDGLVCDAEAERSGLCQQSLAYETIKDRRKRRRVETLNGQPVAAGGVLADYVPFYFTNRSPMLGAIHRDVCRVIRADREMSFTSSPLWKAWLQPGQTAVSRMVTRSKRSRNFTQDRKI